MDLTARTVWNSGGWRAPAGSAVRCRPARTTSLTWHAGGSGSLPSPLLVHPYRSPGWIFEVSRRRTGSVTRPRGRAAEHRPSWASLLHRSERHRCRPGPSAPVGGFRPPLLGFVGPCDPFPFIDLIPGVRLPAVLPPLRTEAAAPIAFRPRRFARPRRFSPPITRVLPGFSPPFTVARDLRACCIPLPIVGFDAFHSSRPVSPAPCALPLLVACTAGHLAGVSPHRSSHPPEDSPSPQPFRVTTVVALPDFAPAAVSTFPTPPLPDAPMLPIPKQCGPSGPCSAERSVPTVTVFG